MLSVAKSFELIVYLGDIALKFSLGFFELLSEPKKFIFYRINACVPDVEYIDGKFYILNLLNQIVDELVDVALLIEVIQLFVGFLDWGLSPEIHF